MTNAIFHPTILKKDVYQKECHREKQAKSNVTDFTFEELINLFPNIPETTAILGKIGSMPILFDLDDPRPGSVLIVNDHLPSIRKFMTVIMNSLASFSQPTSFQFITISHYPEKWMELIQEFDPQFTYCAGVSGDYESSAEDWIMYLAKKAEDRHSGRNNGPAAILFLDDFDLVDSLNIQARLNFEWLLKHGSSSRIWIISGLDIRKNPQKYNQIEKFKTRIYGQIPSNTASIKGLAPITELEQLHPERNFLTKIGTNWIRFWAPKLQGK
ncbi:MAG: hypothetical protein Q7U53_14975 [Anaerolineaceae bacterium]|nr:hypothetical protein [Anaerolineaceae bacterium]